MAASHEIRDINSNYQAPYKENQIQTILEDISVKTTTKICLTYSVRTCP